MLTLMLHLAHFAMDRDAAAHDARTERLPDRLMAEADAEKRNAIVGADQIDDAAGARRRSRARRDDDCLRRLPQQLVGIKRVIAHDGYSFARQALDLLNQVV